MLFQWHNSHVLNIDWIHQPLLVFCINFVRICCSTTSSFIRRGPILEFITLCDWLIIACNFFRSNLGGVYMTLGWLSPRSEFTPVPSHGSIFVYMIPPQNVLRARVTPAWVHPGSCTGVRISLKYEISQRYHVNVKHLPVLVGNRSPDKLEWVAHAQCCDFESHVYFIIMKCTFK